MKRGEVLGKAIFDYRTFFFNKDVDEYKKSITEFIRANESLTDDEFFDKFEKEFATVRVLHQALSRGYLAKISNSLDFIKAVIIVSIIISIVAAIIIASNA